MFDSVFEISQALIIYIIGMHILAMFLTNMFTSNEFSLFSLILAPIVAGVSTYALLNVIAGLDFSIPGFYLRIIAFFVYGIVLFFVLGFDPKRHNSNMLSLGFISLIIVVIMHGVSRETGLFQSMLSSIQERI